MEKLNGLRCRECGRHYPAAPVHVCEFCFGPLEVDYRYDALKGVVTREFGFDTVACASTGNLANSVAAQAAEGRLKSYIFIPADLEQGKVLATLVYNPTLVAVHGTYDEVNRLCSEIADKYRWAFVNVNFRPYYSEGSKSYGFEIVEQLGWRAPGHIVVPCAGGSLITKIWKAIKEFKTLGFIDGP